MNKIIYPREVKEQLLAIKEYISKDSNRNAARYLIKIKQKIELVSKFPFIGKINATMNVDYIRDYIVLGYKVIYKVNKKSITILAIYKHIDFDEAFLNSNDKVIENESSK